MSTKRHAKEWTGDEKRILVASRKKKPPVAYGQIAKLLRRTFEATKKEYSRIKNLEPTFWRTVKALVVLAVCCCWTATSAGAQNFSIDGAFDYETSQASVLYWPDPNGAVGVMVVSDSSIPGPDWENLAVGPKVEFLIDPALKALFGTILPWVNVPENLPVKFYGFGALTWETKGDNDMTGWIGTKACIFPDRRIQPTFIAEYVRPEGGSAEQQELRALFGVTIRF